MMIKTVVVRILIVTFLDGRWEDSAVPPVWPTGIPAAHSLANQSASLLHGIPDA